MTPVRWRTLLLVLTTILHLFFVHVLTELPKSPFLLKFKHQDCACHKSYSWNTKDQTPATLLPKTNYDCSCLSLSDPSYNHYQKYELQVVLEDLANGNIAIDSQQPTASNPQQQQCECTNTSATVPTHRTSSPMKFARLRRRRRSYGYLMGNANPQPPVKWQCSCMPNMTLRDSPAQRMAYYWPVKSKKIYLQHFAPEVKTVYKNDDVKAGENYPKNMMDKPENVMNKPQKDESTAKSPTASANCCPNGFDIVLTFRRNETTTTTTEAPIYNLIFTDPVTPTTSCLCQPSVSYIPPPPPSTPFFFPKIQSMAYTADGATTNNGEDKKDDDNSPKQASVTQDNETPRGPCFTIQFKNPQSPLQPMPIVADPCCLCQSDFSSCSDAKRYRCRNQGINSAEKQKAQSNVELLMEFLEKFKDRLTC